MFDSSSDQFRGIALFSARLAALGALIGASIGCQSDADALREEPLALTSMAVEASLQEMMDAPAGETESSGEDESSGDEAPDAALDAAAIAKEKLNDAIEAKVMAEQAREYKDAELELAELERDASEIKRAEGLRAKRDALKVALEARDRFESTERVIETRKADLSLERSRDRLLKAATDLENMREIMSEEAEAKNKEEIIRRYEKGFEFAQESLGIEEAERAHMVDGVLPSKLAKLSGAVRAAEAELQAEEISARKGLRKVELDVLKARNAAAAAKRKAKKAAAKVARLRSELKSGQKGEPKSKAKSGKKKSKKSAQGSAADGKATVSKKSDGTGKPDKSDK